MARNCHLHWLEIANCTGWKLPSALEAAKKIQAIQRGKMTRRKIAADKAVAAVEAQEELSSDLATSGLGSMLASLPSTDSDSDEEKTEWGNNWSSDNKGENSDSDKIISPNLLQSSGNSSLGNVLESMMTQHSDESEEEKKKKATTTAVEKAAEKVHARIFLILARRKLAVKEVEVVVEGDEKHETVNTLVGMNLWAEEAATAAKKVQAIQRGKLAQRKMATDKVAASCTTETKVDKAEQKANTEGVAENEATKVIILSGASKPNEESAKTAKKVQAIQREKLMRRKIARIALSRTIRYSRNVNYVKSRKQSRKQSRKPKAKNDCDHV